MAENCVVKQPGQIVALMAVTGFNFEALIAGSSPDKTPIPMQRHTARIIMSKGMNTLKLKAAVNSCVNINTQERPMIPPIRQRIIDSKRNSEMIFIFFAPIAFFNPI